MKVIPPIREQVTPPTADEIFGKREPAAHPLDILNLDEHEAVREGYRQARDYREMYLSAMRVAHSLLAACEHVTRERDALRAQLRSTSPRG